MVRAKVQRVVRYLEQRLRHGGVNVSGVVLFGSHANGKATADSDIDLAIVSEDFRGRGILDRVDMTSQAEIETIRKFVVPLDIVTLTPEELESGSSLVAQFAQDGVRL